MSSANIGFLTRRFQLLAERPELMVTDRAALIERMLGMAVPLSELDRTLALHAGELDRLCAHAVRVLRERSAKPLLDVLGVLDPDRIVAMYFALPPKRRVAALRDPAWAYHVGNMPPGVEAAVANIAQLAEETQELQADRARNGANEPRLSDARERAERHARTVMRREVGLPAELTAEEKPAAVAAIFEDELARLGRDPDDVAFAAAMARAVERSGELK